MDRCSHCNKRGLLVKAYFEIEGMKCENCLETVEKAVLSLDGVEEVEVDLGEGWAEVKYDDIKVSTAEIKDVINKAGYKAAEK